LLEANRLGCDVTGWDINPMAYWIVSQEIGHLDVDEYRRAAEPAKRKTVLLKTKTALSGIILFLATFVAVLALAALVPASWIAALDDAGIESSSVTSSPAPRLSP